MVINGDKFHADYPKIPLDDYFLTNDELIAELLSRPPYCDSLVPYNDKQKIAYNFLSECYGSLVPYAKQNEDMRLIANHVKKTLDFLNEIK